MVGGPLTHAAQRPLVEVRMNRGMLSSLLQFRGKASPPGKLAPSCSIKGAHSQSAIGKLQLGPNWSWS